MNFFQINHFIFNITISSKVECRKNNNFEYRTKYSVFEKYSPIWGLLNFSQLFVHIEVYTRSVPYELHWKTTDKTVQIRWSGNIF